MLYSVAVVSVDVDSELGAWYGSVAVYWWAVWL